MCHAHFFKTKVGDPKMQGMHYNFDDGSQQSGCYTEHPPQSYINQNAVRWLTCFKTRAIWHRGFKEPICTAEREINSAAFEPDVHEEIQVRGSSRNLVLHGGGGGGGGGGVTYNSKWGGGGGEVEGFRKGGVERFGGVFFGGGGVSERFGGKPRELRGLRGES